MMTFQLLGKDEVDAEVTSGRWQAYIDSFVSVRAHFSLTPHVHNLLMLFSRMLNLGHRISRLQE